MLFVLPPLPYSYNALEPYIDARTMEVHYTKHHQSYADQLNKALERYPEVMVSSVSDLLEHLDTVPEDIRSAVRNHGGGFYNHTFFWNCMRPYTPAAQQAPTGPLRAAIDRDFASFDAYKKEFSVAAKNRFGSGWVWLVCKSDGLLTIITTANQDSPISDGYIPILGLDLWEHAYYLHYQNRRADYIDAWWNLVNWPFAESCYAKAIAPAQQAVKP